ncbi:hypothetical protein AUK22_11400 [bacterium CG2_30_54_10]|nr:MAG: hypothetical protein AUK22_11400 [bacterium CG2_30_54_10]
MNTRISLKFVAFVLGVILWVYVNIILSPVVRRSFPAPVELRNLPNLMRATLKTQTVSVVLDGTRRDFILTRPDAVQASIDLINLRPGTFLMPVRVSPLPGMVVVSVSPSQIEVQAKMLAVKEFDVSAEVLGQTAEGFISEPPVVKPPRVKVEGPPELVERVTGCKVSVFLQDVKNSISENQKVTIFSAEGEIATPSIKAIPDKVTIVILVKEGFPTRTVPVASPTFINKPPDGLRLESFAIDPSEVTISGPLRALKQVNEVNTLPIDLSSLVGSSSVVGLLKAPLESVRIVGTPTVMVNISIERTKVVRPYRGLPLTLKNSTNQHCVITPSSYTLLLKGFVEDLEKVHPNQLGITLDVRGEKPGSYSVELTCPPTLPENVAALEIQPGQVNVEISETSATDTGTSTVPTHSP